ncbi:MAG: IPT/TIG domain-containing protein [Pyrinomonadaceae bacterium]
MNIFAGKSPTERNKIIAASVLGIMALFALYLAFGGSIFSRKTTITVTASPSPSPSTSPNQAGLTPITIPDDAAIIRDWTTTPVSYSVSNFYAPDAGRNIFAFYEPPPPTPYSPTPIPPEKPEIIKTPVPPPPPPITIAFISPQSVFAGSRTFRLQLTGEKFTPDSQILFNGSALPTVFVSANQIYAEVPANLILGEGPRQISVVTPDGKLYSNQFLLNVQAPPRPQFEYYGIVARKRYNNDTAYVKEQGKPDVTAARLNDILEGRFKLVSISQNELIVEDTNLGFRHKIALVSESASTGAGTGRGTVRTDGSIYVPYNPPVVNTNPNINQQNIPGIPNNIPRYNPTPREPNPEQKDPDGIDPSDTDDGDGND